MAHTQKIIKWVNNRPVPTNKPILSKEAVSDLPIAVMSIPYRRTPLEKEFGIDQDLEGMTNGEVMMLRMSEDAARGNHKAADMILDRILGKPKMVTENKNLNLNYQDFLMEIARTDESESESEESIIEEDSQPFTE
jgi:hypothetical protein